MAKTKEARPSPQHHDSKGVLIYPWVLVFWGIYLFAVYNTPNDAVTTAFDITERTAVLLRFTVAVPYLLMWLAIAYAFVKLLTYSNILKKSKESASFRYFAYGTATLLGGLIFTAIVSSVRSIINTDVYFFNLQLEPLLTVLVNYGHTFPYAIAFGLFFFGTHKLRTEEKIAFNVRRFIILAVPILTLAYVWLEVIFSIPAGQIVNEAQGKPIYYLRDSLIVLTIVAPSLLAWFFGIAAVSNMRSYQKNVTGVIYKKTLNYFVLGLMGMTLGSILLQSLHSLGADQLIGLGLEQLLAVIYFFLLIQAFGFVYMALGAKQLTKIETV